MKIEKSKEKWFEKEINIKIKNSTKKKKFTKKIFFKTFQRYKSVKIVNQMTDRDLVSGKKIIKMY